MIHIITSGSSSRLHYVLDFIFRQVYDSDYVVITPEDAKLLKTGFAVLYSNHTFESPLQVPCVEIPQHHLLFENDIKSQLIDIKTDKTTEFPYFFELTVSKKTDLAFDIFAMVFYLISRYEEYLPHTKDRYHRFPANVSLAVQKDFIELPLVDIWLNILFQKIRQKSSFSPDKKQKFGIFPTIDIDTVWAYAFKGKNHLFGITKDILTGRFSNIKDRYDSVKNPDIDPFFTFEKIENILGPSAKTTLFFILFAKNPNDLDINHKRDLMPFRDWLVSFSKKNLIGIHPSFFSHRGKEEMKEEMIALEETTGLKIKYSRQHFLSFSLPKTYQILTANGISDDFSMGFPEVTGYRASTGYSFFWYDLTEEKKTGLRVHPVQIMDVTLKKYQKLSVEKAILQVEKMKATSQKWDIPLRFIWHNSSFYKGFGWKNWENVLKSIMNSNYHED